jgi:site-specific DNA-methyltransferase (cytosine-N4-specific)
MSKEKAKSQQELSLFPLAQDSAAYILDSFSAEGAFPDVARRELESRYSHLIKVTNRFDRRSVSYQLSKNASVHSWLKYKEGFSADLVNQLIEEFGLEPGNTVIDPFLGSGTTAFVAQLRGINSVGFDLLPTSAVAIVAKSFVLRYDLNELNKLHDELRLLDIPREHKGNLNAVRITEGAYPKETERDLAFLQSWLSSSSYSIEARNLLLLCLVNSLERVSYTNKDGQYLRWDFRSDKVISHNHQRINAGHPPLKTILDKGDLPRALDVVVSEFDSMLQDISKVQRRNSEIVQGDLRFIQGSVLLGLPELPDSSIDAVITSPPYCNRYDYTRTYALELAFLGLGELEFKQLRQALLTATVENRSKIDLLADHYSTLNRHEEFCRYLEVLNDFDAFQEILHALRGRAASGDVNNNGVVRMVEGYFTELALVYAELFRVCKPGSHVAFVNDNVRYGGEVIPVDFISTGLAERLGFVPVVVYCLKQQKGNSSQQMKRFGRTALRKSITVWKKPK